MKVLGIPFLAACAALIAGCASVHQTKLVDCSADAALSRGLKDGARGRHARLSFAKTCSPATRDAAIASYNQGFETSRAKRRPTLTVQQELPDADVAEAESEEESEEAPTLAAPLPVRAPSASAMGWVCEIEASSKIFTGVGGTQDEALGSARANCGSHFQASYCTKSDCKQNL